MTTYSNVKAQIAKLKSEAEQYRRTAERVVGKALGRFNSNKERD